MIYPLALLGLAGAVAFAVFMPEDEMVLGLSPGEIASVVASALMLVLILSGLRADWRGRARAAILAALAWVAIFGVVMIAYVHRADVSRFSDRMMDEIAPGRRIVSPPGEAHAVRGPDGHYVFEGLAEGASMRFLFDTGASTVVLRAQDAARLGLDPAKLDYRVTVSTANGKTLAAPYLIKTLTIGAITLRDLRALVARPDALRENLLGHSFLERLSGYAMERNRIVLRQ